MEAAFTRSEMPARRIELDFIRGIAIFAVMVFHFHVVHTDNVVLRFGDFMLRGFGKEGVNLFFTLSGFLVGGLLLKQLDQLVPVNPKQFLIRRIFKIWPAYYVLILFHVVAKRHPIKSFLLQNIIHLQNYLGTSIAQTWSLAVEEHFYIALAITIALVSKFRVRPGALIISLTVVCAAVLLARCVVVANGDLQAAFMHTQYRIDSLLVGVILAAIAQFKPTIYRSIANQRNILVLVVIANLAWMIAMRSHVALDESVGYTIQAIGFAALIVLCVEYSGRLANTLLYRAIAWLGVYSYGIYLWHSLALAPGDYLIHWMTIRGYPAEAIWIAALVAQFVIGTSLGYATTRLIEFPSLHIRDRLFPARARLTDGIGAPSAERVDEAQPASAR